MNVEDEPPALSSRATVDEEGMINIWVDLQKQLTNLPHPSGQDSVGKETGIDHEGFDKCPPLNILIFIVGSRGTSRTSSALTLETDIVLQVTSSLTSPSL